MRRPQLVVFGSGGGLAGPLTGLAGENRWLVREPRKVDDALSLARDRRPTVLVVAIDPAADRPDAFALIADAHRLCPDAAVLAVGEAKLSDADRAEWVAALLDLGARYVLFPPFARPVFKDVVGGLMAGAVRRVTGTAPAPTPAGVIDLADEDVDD